MDLEGLFNLGILFNYEADVASNVATNIIEESAEAVAIREASSLTSPGFDDLVRSLHGMESVNMFTGCSQVMLKFKNEEQQVMSGLPLGLAALCEQNVSGCGPDCRSGCLTLFCTNRPREAEALYLDGERHNRIVHDASLITGFNEAGIRSEPGRRRRAIHKDQKAFGGRSLIFIFFCVFVFVVITGA